MSKPILIPPFVVLLQNCLINYIGRAKASSEGGSFLIITKKDGTIVLHNLEKGLKPTYYNPSKELNIKLKNDNLILNSLSKRNERLIVKGKIIQIMDVEKNIDFQSRELTAIIGTEKKIVEEIIENPEQIGLKKKDFEGMEVRISSGRIDLLFIDRIIEVKKRAGARTYDQLSRYLRGSEKNLGIIVCIKATNTLKKAVENSDIIKLVERLEWGEFDNELPKENY